MPHAAFPRRGERRCRGGPGVPQPGGQGGFSLLRGHSLEAAAFRAGKPLVLRAGGGGRSVRAAAGAGAAARCRAGTGRAGPAAVPLPPAPLAPPRLLAPSRPQAVKWRLLPTGERKLSFKAFFPYYCAAVLPVPPSPPSPAPSGCRGGSAAPELPRRARSPGPAGLRQGRARSWLGAPAQAEVSLPHTGCGPRDPPEPPGAGGGHRQAPSEPSVAPASRRLIARRNRSPRVPAVPTE